MKESCKKLFFMFAAFLAISVTSVKADEMSAEFQSMLTEGKVVIESIAPYNDDSAMIIVSEYINAKYNQCYADNFTNNYTKCNITCGGFLEGEDETHEVTLEYKYDSAIKSLVDEYTSKIPEDKNKFLVNDLEIINFWVNGKGNIELLSNYSSEFKKYIDYKNFNLDIRLGEDASFFTEAGGPGIFKYNNVTYKFYSTMFVRANHIVYVPTDTSEDKLLSIAQKRINEYIGENKVVLSEVAQTDWLEEYILNETSFNDSMPEALRKTVTEIEEEATDYLSEQMTSAGATKIFKAVIGEDEYYLFIVANTDKMVQPTYKTSDVKTNVTITSEAGIVPLDALIKADKLTSGTEYDKISKILNTNNSDMFNLNLYSNSLEKNFTKELDDGMFEVQIPIDKKFNGKSLIVYYIDENGKKIEYEVKVKDNYAIFHTNHFSVYTLAEKEVIANPKTIDGIVSIVLLGSISIVGIICSSIYLKKKKKM